MPLTCCWCLNFVYFYNNLAEIFRIGKELGVSVVLLREATSIWRKPDDHEPYVVLTPVNLQEHQGSQCVKHIARQGVLCEYLIMFCGCLILNCFLIQEKERAFGMRTHTQWGTQTTTTLEILLMTVTINLQKILTY